MLTAKNFIEKMESFRSDAEAVKMQRYFKTGKGEYGEGDVFMGVRMGNVFNLAKAFKDMELNEVEQLLENQIHEIRTGAVSIMDFQARDKKTSKERLKELYELYLRRHDRINNWDLVDRSAIYVVGGYLFDKPRTILYNLAKSEDLWERRTSIISTAYFIKKKDLDDTYKIAEMLLQDKHDLIHKAAGWMLRYAGDQDIPGLKRFLDKYASTMPRTMLRYAIEKFSKEDRNYYLKLK